MIDPNDFRPSETVEAREHTVDEGAVEHTPEHDWRGLVPAGLTPEDTEDDTDETIPDVSDLTLAELRAIRELLTNQNVLFAQIAGVISELGTRADSLFAGDGPKLPGPAGMILSALIPKR